MEKYFWIVLFCCGTCFGQKGYDAQGELVVISPESGIIVKQNGSYFIFNIRAELDNGKLSYHTELQEINSAALFDLFEKKDNIFPDQITVNEKNHLLQTGFAAGLNNRTYTIRLVAGLFYTVIGNEEGHDTLVWAGLGFPVRFGSKEIMLIPELKAVIVPMEKEFRFIGEYNKIKNFKTVKVKGKINKRIINSLSDYIDAEEFTYTDTVDCLKGLRNCFDEIIAPPVYDSIIHDGYFIKCYREGGVDLYNILLQKLKLKGIRACEQPKYSSPYLGILQDNKVRAINVLGKEDYTFYWDTAPYMPSGKGSAKIEIVKEGQDFFIINRDIGAIIVDGEFFQEPKRKLYRTEKIDSIIFAGRTEVELDLMAAPDPLQYVFCRMDNGKYDIKYLYDLISKTPYERERPELPDQLDSITHERYLAIYKDGLVGNFPYNRFPKYKKLEPFYYGFARYILPNRKKGWLDMQGREYPDE